MQKRKLMIGIASILFLVGIAMVSCTDKDDNKDTATCTDGIQNQGEEDVDCGGPCPPCIKEPGMTAKVSGYAWTALNLAASLNGGLLNITGDNGVTPFYMIILDYNGPQQVGTHNLSPTTMLLNMNSKEFNLVSGTITFTEFNTTAKRISGTFSFEAKHPGETLVISVTQGSFTNLTY